ncbi:MAG TPA: IPT/TIG domain-containing protein, partial [Thermoanaerobaculia bacterium]
LQTKAIEMGMTASQAKDIVDTFEVNGVRVDPMHDVPAEDDFREYSAKVGLYILQFAGNWDPAMAAELTALGVTVVAPVTTNNAAIVHATLTNVRKTDALPWLAWRDLLHPRFKGTRRHVDPERYYSATFTVPASAPDANRIAQQLALPAHAGTSSVFNVLGADVTTLFQHPLVSSVMLADSEVEIYGVLPPQGPPGSEIILNTSYTANITEVRFGGVPATFTRVDHDRIRATVPQLPNGPVEILVFGANGWRQVLPSRESFGFRVAETLGHSTFARGDLVTVTREAGSLLLVNWYTPQGELRRARGNEGGNGQLFFGMQGFLESTSADVPWRYDAFLNRIGDGPSMLTAASAVTLAKNGTAFLVVGSELRRHAANGNLEAKGSLPLVRSIDLGADQCTLVVAGADALNLFDGCRMQPLATLRSGGWSSARFLPDGTILAGSDEGLLLRLTTGGGVLHTESAGSGIRIALSPDASFAYVAHAAHDVGRISRFDLALNELTATPLAPGPVSSFAVYGEWTAARGDAAYDDPIVVESVQGFDQPSGTPVTITGRGWLSDAIVTIGGLPVHGASVTSTRISFLMPQGTKSSREIVIRNPNGQRGTFTVPGKVKSKRRAV